MSLLPLMEWLDTHAWSTALHESLFMYPLTESVHVWGLALFVGFAMLLDLRLMGVFLPSVPASTIANRLLPWTVTGFIIMIITGFMLLYAIPVRTYLSVWFRLKVILLILAGINVFVFHSGIWRRVQDWDLDKRPPKKARFAGIASLVLWGCIIFAGRLIAYNWFDCDRQPQAPIVNFLAGCPEDLANRGL